MDYEKNKESFNNYHYFDVDDKYRRLCQAAERNP